jgi:hypothetical protein
VKQFGHFYKCIGEPVTENGHLLSDGTGCAQVDVEALRKEHVSDADAMLASGAEAEVLDVHRRSGAGA